MYLTNIEELNHEIMLRLDYKATMQFCQTNSMFNLCHDVQFWEDKIPYDDHYVEIKSKTLQTIDGLKKGIGISIKPEKIPIRYLLPERIFLRIVKDLEELELEDPDVNHVKYINLFYYNGIWYVKYIEEHNFYPFRFDYRSDIDEVTSILMKSYYYHYNGVITIYY